MSQSAQRGIQIFFWLFVVVGVVALGCGAWNLLRSLRCTRWPVTEGVVTSAEISSQSGGRRGKTYAPSLSYDYRVAGTSYTGTRLAYGVMESSLAHAQAALDRYPVGQKVPVHYAPNDPGQAVLETGVHGGTWICFAVGTILVVAGAIFLRVTPPAKGSGFAAS